ncbi:MAG TPA: NAD(P)-dependent oxidoreductase [Steroidobacteraceae bacterium]|nr:NAD(P)-dependent oxidoreductase [Steroidobacteraceae bacterium]
MKVGFIGLGAMGLHMARNLHGAGLLSIIWNRSSEKAQQLAAELGCDLAASPAALAERCDAIVLCVAADADVLDVIDQLLPGAAADLLVMDCSTVSSATAQQAATLLATRGAQFLDCPVSGGTEGARDAALAIMVGGSEQVFQRSLPVLQAMGRTITRFGDTGAGQAAKATNQIMCAGIIRAIAEAMAFAHAQGLPLDRVVDTLSKGAGSSWYFVNRAPNMVRGSYPAGFRVRLHAKDLRICRDMAAAHGVQLPVIETLLADYAQLIAEGHGDEDISAVYRLTERLFG